MAFLRHVLTYLGRLITTARRITCHRWCQQSGTGWIHIKKVCVSREHNITERIESLFVFSIHKSFQELNCSLKILNCGWMTVLVSYKPHQEKSPKRELKVLWWVSKQLHTWSLFREARVKKWDASDVEGPKAGEKQKIHFWRSFTYLQWLLCCSSVLLLQASLLHLKSIN